MATAASVVVRMTADTAEFTTALNKSSREASNWANKIQREIDAMTGTTDQKRIERLQKAGADSFDIAKVQILLEEKKAIEANRAAKLKAEQDDAAMLREVASTTTNYRGSVMSATIANNNFATSFGDVTSGIKLLMGGGIAAIGVKVVHSLANEFGNLAEHFKKVGEGEAVLKSVGERFVDLIKPLRVIRELMQSISDAIGNYQLMMAQMEHKEKQPFKVTGDGSGYANLQAAMKSSQTFLDADKMTDGQKRRNELLKHEEGLIQAIASAQQELMNQDYQLYLETINEAEAEKQRIRERFTEKRMEAQWAEDNPIDENAKKLDDFVKQVERAKAILEKNPMEIALYDLEESGVTGAEFDRAKKVVEEYTAEVDHIKALKEDEEAAKKFGKKFTRELRDSLEWEYEEEIKNLSDKEDRMKALLGKVESRSAPSAALVGSREAHNAVAQSIFKDQQKPQIDILRKQLKQQETLVSIAKQQLEEFKKAGVEVE